MPEPAGKLGGRTVVGVLHVDVLILLVKRSDILDNIRNTGEVIDRSSYCPNDQS